MAQIKGEQIADSSISTEKLILPPDGEGFLRGDGSWGNPTPSPGAGGETANVEALTADKTLTATDAPIQMYTCTANRTINLPTTGVATGQKFEIWNKNNETSSLYLEIKQAGTVLYRVASQTKIELRWDGANWITDWKYNISIGGYTHNNHNYGVGIGYDVSNNHNYGVGIGISTNNNHTYGVGIGRAAYSNHSYGVGIGYGANNNHSYGVGVGANASSNSKQHCTVALGAYSKAERNREIVSGSDDSTNCRSKFAVQKWKWQDLTFASQSEWKEVFIDGASMIVALLPNALYKFRIQVSIMGLDTDKKPNGEYYGEELVGSIATDLSNNASVIGSGFIVQGSTCYCTDTAEPDSTAFSAYSAGERLRERLGGALAGLDFKILPRQGYYHFFVRHSAYKESPNVRFCANAVITEMLFK